MVKKKRPTVPAAVAQNTENGERVGRREGRVRECEITCERECKRWRECVCVRVSVGEGGRKSSSVYSEIILLI